MTASAAKAHSAANDVLSVYPIYRKAGSLAPVEVHKTTGYGTGADARPR
jgi:hypothetical protein